MLGSSWTRLLATLLVIPLPSAALAQSDRLNSRPGFDPAVPAPRVPQPIGEPVRPPIPEFPTPSGLPQFARAAGTIFSGTVTAISRKAAPPGSAIETVAVTFRVEQAIRGAIPGGSLTISQWMALWSSGQRYRVGERVMLFLYPPSKLGLTSLVGGELGRFRIDPAGGVFLNSQQVPVFRNDPVIGGKTHVLFSDFASAVRRASAEEPRP